MAVLIREMSCLVIPDRHESRGRWVLRHCCYCFDFRAQGVVALTKILQSVSYTPGTIVNFPVYFLLFVVVLLFLDDVAKEALLMIYFSGPFLDAFGDSTAVVAVVSLRLLNCFV